MFYEDEIWQPIFGYPNYEVSNFGRVFNIKHGRFINTRISNSGYERVGLSINGDQRYFSVHRLVAFAFLFRPLGTTQVNHIDGDKLYNVVENLEWVTISENHKHAFNIGLKTPSNMRPVRILETNEEFESIRACAKTIGGIPQGVHNCLYGIFHTYLGFTFEYVD